MKNYLLSFALGVVVTLGATKAYQTLSTKTTSTKVGECIRVLGDATVYKVTYVTGNTIEAETLETGLFGKSRIAFYNVGDSSAEVPAGMVRGTLIDVKCE